MKIGINEVLIYDRSSGTRQRELNMMPALLRQIHLSGWESIVYVARDLEKETIARLVGARDVTRVVRTPLPAVPTYQRLLKGFPYWKSQIRRDGLDIFHTAYYPIPSLAIPCVLTVNDLRFVHMPETYSKGRQLFLQAVVPRSVRRATRIIAISHDTKKDLVEQFSVDPNRIDVVHIPADPMFRRVDDQGVLESARLRYQLPRKYILYVGHLEPRKDLVLLIQAYADLRSKRAVEHDLVIVGKPTLQFQSVIDTARASAFSSSIVFTGYVEDGDMPAVYTMADALAFPSLHEGFGVPVLEAMACGVPVVTSTVSALPELAGDAAVLVNPYDVSDIASGLESAVADGALRNRLIEHGLKRVKLFTPEEAARRTCQTYERVLHE